MRIKGPMMWFWENFPVIILTQKSRAREKYLNKHIYVATKNVHVAPVCCFVVLFGLLHN